MRFDPDLVAALESALRRVRRQADRLAYTRSHLEHPGDLSDQRVLERYEALTSRFARLQDLLFAPFRTIARLELEERALERIPDLLNLMEKRGLVERADDWVTMRRVRNAIAHEYWDTEAELAELLDDVYRRSAGLFRVVERLERYAKRFGTDEPPGSTPP